MKTRNASRSRPRKHNVLIVDDHPVLREGLAQRINAESDLIVCGEARTAREALRAVVALQPEIVVLDLSLPEGHGLELIKDLKTLHPDLPVLVFTMHDESIFAERTLRAGASGYVMKQEPPECLLDAIRTILKGDYFISDKTSSACLRLFFRQPASDSRQPVALLSDRELEVFQLLGQGLSTKEIANRLGRSVKTIETHRARTMEKLEVKSASQLVSRASRWLEQN